MILLLSASCLTAKLFFPPYVQLSYFKRLSCFYSNVVSYTEKVLKDCKRLEKLKRVFKAIVKTCPRSRFSLSNEKNDNGVHLIMHQEHAYITLRHQNDLPHPMTNLWLMSSKIDIWDTSHIYHPSSRRWLNCK